jgi:threonine/homoserine/homoserine lactone efflux protein
MPSPFGLLYLLGACWLGYTAVVAFRRGELEAGDPVGVQKIKKEEKPRMWLFGVIGLAAMSVAFLGLAVYSFLRDIR